jgi:hypothetical protein
MGLQFIRAAPDDAKDLLWREVQLFCPTAILLGRAVIAVNSGLGVCTNSPTRSETPANRVRGRNGLQLATNAHEACDLGQSGA